MDLEQVLHKLVHKKPEVKQQKHRMLDLWRMFQDNAPSYLPFDKFANWLLSEAKRDKGLIRMHENPSGFSVLT